MLFAFFRLDSGAGALKQSDTPGVFAADAVTLLLGTGRLQLLALGGARTKAVEGAGGVALGGAAGGGLEAIGAGLAGVMVKLAFG